MLNFHVELGEWRCFLIEEHKLIKLIIKKNDKAAAGQLVQHYYKDIFSYVFKQTGNEELSKDLTQEIFISMLKSINKFDDKKASFKTWLYKIASNKIVDNYRSKYYKHVTLVEDIEENAVIDRDNLEKSFETKENVNEVLSILNTLNSEHQKIFRLKVFGNMTFKDIALLFDIPESTVKTKYYSTVRKIKKLLEVKYNGQG